MKTITNPAANDLAKSENPSLEDNFEKKAKSRRRFISRRSFLGTSLAAGAGTIGAGLLSGPGTASASAELSSGDAALLRFPAALETLEADFWIQYNELAGVQDGEVPGGSGNPQYKEKVEALDEDFPQYIHDNTDDDITHFQFLNAYLVSKGAQPVDLESFRTLQGSQATGSSGALRL